MLIRVLIADDEPRIRRGIKNIINWNEFGFELIGEAEDGEMALEIAKEKKPDLCLVDICMPFLNGLEFIEEINNHLDNPIIIIVSGHDEFKYAQTALQLKVFDYILKPIEKDELRRVILKAKEEIEKRDIKKVMDEFKSIQLEKSNYYLKENFIKDLINGKVKEDELNNQIKYFNINYSDSMGMLVIKLLDRKESVVINKWQKELLCYGIQNIVKEVMSNFKFLETIIDSKKQVVIITDITPIKKWMDITIDIENCINKYLKIDVAIERDFLTLNPLNINKTYKAISSKLFENSKKTPIVMEVQKYIERNYCNESLSITEISERLGISQTYLTRLLKKELGITFTDYLTSIRIKNAIVLMEDPSIKMYQVAELVGYSTQHYFSNVFKKYMGVAPLDYKRGSKG